MYIKRKKIFQVYIEIKRIFLPISKLILIFLGIYKLIVTEKYILMSTWSLSEIVKKKSMNSFLKK